MARHNDSKQINKPLLSEHEILDLHYRAEQDRGSNQNRQEVEHRTLGDVRSVYRGYGLDYDESRPYFPGDELRFMNWRVTARTGEPHMKVFREERNPAVFIVVDRRQNMCFGTRRRLKVTQAVRVAAITAFAARLSNAPVAGLLLESIENDYDNDIPSAGLTWIAETNNETGVFNFIHAANKPCPPARMSQQNTQSKNSAEESLLHVIKLLTAMLPQGSSVVLISDFHDLEDNCRSSLLELSMTHQLQAMHIIDPVEEKLPECGSLLLPSEGGELSSVNSSDKKINTEYQAAAANYLLSKQALFLSLGISCQIFK
ncbi:MAG: DUF58 domain-containing protein, partial [Gammaproteobacteria bacterium]|nr:DUF58 domain-containing protein [Gammaproteobacteria bacterium]